MNDDDFHQTEGFGAFVAVISLAALLAALTIFAVGSYLLSTPAQGLDRGQYNDAPDSVRQWFKGVLSPSGIPCCDIADGHRTQSERRGKNFWANVEGAMVEVPASAVVYGAGNPIGDAVVWYYRRDGVVVIRCFVPASEV